MIPAIIYTNEKGGVALCMPSGEIPVEAVQAKDIPEGVESYIVDLDTLPRADMDFFGAWEQVGGVVSINIEKAKDITKERLRFQRQPFLAEQDVLFQRALETGQPTADIVAEKQRLRDLPSLADACTTLDELRALKAEK